MKQIIKTYGPYRLELNYHDNDFCQVSMKNVGEKMPLIWSTGLTKAQANGAIKLFEAIGYFDMPVEA
jgi:hypothetical protein